jgi:predicted  nucleic acid-binding Zn-ribbon protein
MLEVVERLLILQDRDRKLRQTHAELAGIEPQRYLLQAKLTQVQTKSESAKLRLKQIESDRKKLELEAESRKESIDRYSLQQFQTRKNEEYRALAHEIDTCKQEIVKLEDQQLECMEEAEKVQKEAAQAAQDASTLKKDVEDQIAKLGLRQKNLIEQLAELENDRDKLAEAVEPSALARYERLTKHRGENVIVGIDHGVCGGCHMKLPTQIVVTCRGEDELMVCPNCARVLYYTRDMDLAVAE